MTQSSIFDPRSSIYCLGSWPVARFSDFSVRKEKTEPCSIFMFLYFICHYNQEVMRLA